MAGVEIMGTARLASLTEARRAAGKRLWKDYKYLEGKNVWLNKEFYTVKEKSGKLRYYYPDIEIYPWADAVPVPARVLGVYRTYILVEILPHLNPNGFSQELSKPYRQTIHKHDLDRGYIKVKEMSLNGSKKHSSDTDDWTDDRDILF